ncbi:hypothetical protein [Niallia taxi]|uniref:hypothetical protein n=1 Tax=Bacillaceae TaxID=186817 RepID=UPI00254CFEC4|nr:hypothetical protein [Niallia taxi]MDK8643850.1 hypothetical protein [Niallia taxi]
MILKNLEEQIIKTIEDYIFKMERFDFEGFEFMSYETGVFKFLSYEKELELKTLIKFNPYNGDVLAVFEDDRETSWHIGTLKELHIHN